MALEGVLFGVSLIMWVMVLAWHEKYSKRPVLVWDTGRRFWIAATLCALLGGLLMSGFVDPWLRTLTPEAYPDDLAQWRAILFFRTTFALLFLILAPLAFFLRLLPSWRHAAGATVCFGVFVTSLKINAMPTAPSPAWIAGLMILKAASMSLGVFFYLRGGALLVFWWVLLSETRHLPGLFAGGAGVF